MSDYQAPSSGTDSNEPVKPDLTINRASVDSFEVKRFSTGGWIKFILGAIFLFPIRAFLTTLGAIIIMVIYIINLPIIGPADKPQNWFVRAERRFIGFLWCRFTMFLCGFFWIKEHGKKHPDAKILVVNHSSSLDMFYLMYKFTPAFIVAEFVAKNFWLGPLARVMNCFTTNRNSSGNSNNLLTQMQARLEDNETSRLFAPLVIFSEGGTSNGSCLNYIHSGAFVPGAPVQPVLLEYKDPICPTQWSVRSWPMHFGTMMCNLINHLEVTYLPLYYPSEAEKANPRLYAQNVKNAMSRGIAFQPENVKRASYSTSNVSTPGSQVFSLPSDVDEHAPITAASSSTSPQQFLRTVNPFFIPQTLLTYKDRQELSRIRKELKRRGLPIPQPRTREQIVQQHLRYLSTHLLLNQESTETENSAPTINVLHADPATPLLSHSDGASTSSSRRSPYGPKIAFIDGDPDEKVSLVNNSGLLFLLETPTESCDYRIPEYHSQQPLPSPQLMELINLGFHKPAENSQST